MIVILCLWSCLILCLLMRCLRIRLIHLRSYVTIAEIIVIYCDVIITVCRPTCLMNCSCSMLNKHRMWHLWNPRTLFYYTWHKHRRSEIMRFKITSKIFCSSFSFEPSINTIVTSKLISNWIYVHFWIWSYRSYSSHLK